MMSTLARTLGALLLSLGLSASASAASLVFEAEFAAEGGRPPPGGYARVEVDTILAVRQNQRANGGKGSQEERRT